MSNSKRAATILVVDRSEESASVVAEILDRAGYRVRVAHDVERAVQTAAAHSIDLVVSEIVLGPSGDGLDLAERLAQRQPQVPLIYMSGHARPRGGPLLYDPVLAKLFAPAVLLSRVARALGG